MHNQVHRLRGVSRDCLFWSSSRHGKKIPIKYQVSFSHKFMFKLSLYGRRESRKRLIGVPRNITWCFRTAWWEFSDANNIRQTIDMEIRRILFDLYTFKRHWMSQFYLCVTVRYFIALFNVFNEHCSWNQT